MTLKKQDFTLILILSLLLSCSIEASPSRSPRGLDTSLAPSDEALAGQGHKQEIVNKLKESIPKGEEFLQKIKKRIDETPSSTASEQCLNNCMATYEKAIKDLKKLADILSSSTSNEVDFDPIINKAEVERCDTCLTEVAKEDPQVMNYIEWFYKATEQVGEEINKYNS